MSCRADPSTVGMVSGSLGSFEDVDGGGQVVAPV